MALSMTRTWAKGHPYNSARNEFQCQVTLCKNPAILTLGGTARYWSKATHVIPGTTGHWLGLDLRDPGSRGSTEPIRIRLAGLYRKRLKGLCSLVTAPHQSWLGAPLFPPVALMGQCKMRKLGLVEWGRGREMSNITSVSDFLILSVLYFSQIPDISVSLQ